MSSRKNFSGTEFTNKAIGFDRPIQLPRDEAQRREWQSASKLWWESTPMRYDWREKISAPPGTKEYFQEIDKRLLNSSRHYLNWRRQPYDNLIPFENLNDKDVLEIGVGQGTHAQLIAPHCKSFIGIDLTSAATQMTLRRFEIIKISGIIQQMDAEEMTFADASFDFIWSWGVIHHSANTRHVLEEMARVLRPSGTAIVMVYHRSWWHFYVGGLLRGIFRRQLRKGRKFHDIAQAATDGSIARYYTRKEWCETTANLFHNERIRIYGLKSELLPIPAGRVKAILERIVPDAISRFFTNRMRLGTFLVAEMRRISQQPLRSCGG
jgi:ubiquinone/menaquinone biosynthesis C-methylase UbiE